MGLAEAQPPGASNGDRSHISLCTAFRHKPRFLSCLYFVSLYFLLLSVVHAGLQWTISWTLASQACKIVFLGEQTLKFLLRFLSSYTCMGNTYTLYWGQFTCLECLLWLSRSELQVFILGNAHRFFTHCPKQPPKIVWRVPLYASVVSESAASWI